MTHPFYDFDTTTERKAYRFDFVSVGLRIIPKIIIVERIYEPNLFNLILADRLPNGHIDILTVSDNGDRDKILATVVQVLIAFFEYQPNAWVLFTGSTPARTRLYRIAISKELHGASEQFDVYGICEGQLEPFRLNRPYDKFAFSRKRG